MPRTSDRAELEAVIIARLTASVKAMTLEELTRFTIRILATDERLKDAIRRR